MKASRQSVFQSSTRGRALAAAAYTRNMSLVREFKCLNPCCYCKCHYDHFMMRFARPKRGPSISSLAGSRCSPEKLARAMENTPLFCLDCFSSSVVHVKRRMTPGQSLRTPR